MNNTPVWITNLLYLRNRPVSLNHMGDPTAFFVRYLNDKITYMGELIMPARSSKSGTGVPFAPTEFINVRLNQRQKEDFVVWSSRKAEDVALDVAGFISEGHKIGITWDLNNTCWIVSATCKVPGDPNENCCLTSRSDDWYEAMVMCVFKDRVIGKDVPWRDMQEDTNWG